MKSHYISLVAPSNGSSEKQRLSIQQANFNLTTTATTTTTSSSSDGDGSISMIAARQWNSFVFVQECTSIS